MEIDIKLIEIIPQIEGDDQVLNAWISNEENTTLGFGIQIVEGMKTKEVILSKDQAKTLHEYLNYYFKLCKEQGRNSSEKKPKRTAGQFW